jgi:RimJ/RimL family protein N-acetyltransferase
MIPTLDTPRLLLRAHTLEDFPVYAAMRADPVVMKFMGKGDLLSEEESWAKFQAMPGHWSLMGYGYWAITEKASGAYLGNIGYADKKRPGEHPASGAPEMGWALSPSVHGKGYASEALKASLQLGPRSLRSRPRRLRHQRWQRRFHPPRGEERLPAIRDGHAPWAGAQGVRAESVSDWPHGRGGAKDEPAF